MERPTGTESPLRRFAAAALAVLLLAARGGNDHFEFVEIHYDGAAQ